RKRAGNFFPAFFVRAAQGCHNRQIRALIDFSCTVNINTLFLTTIARYMANRSTQRILPWLLGLLSGLLLWAAWPTSPLTLLIFIAFIPLLRLTDLVQHRGVYFGSIFLAMLVWN